MSIFRKKTENLLEPTKEEMIESQKVQIESLKQQVQQLKEEPKTDKEKEFERYQKILQLSMKSRPDYQQQITEQMNQFMQFQKMMDQFTQTQRDLAMQKIQQDQASDGGFNLEKIMEALVLAKLQGPQQQTPSFPVQPQPQPEYTEETELVEIPQELQNPTLEQQIPAENAPNQENPAVPTGKPVVPDNMIKKVVDRIPWIARETFSKLPLDKQQQVMEQIRLEIARRT